MQRTWRPSRSGSNQLNDIRPAAASQTRAVPWWLAVAADLPSGLRCDPLGSARGDALLNGEYRQRNQRTKRQDRPIRGGASVGHDSSCATCWMSIAAKAAAEAL